MINGLGVLGWGVGGIEAEAAMLGQPSSMLIPQVVGFKLTGRLPEGATATDLVLTVTQMLRKNGVVGKFVEFFGDGLAHLAARRSRDDRQHGARVRRDLRHLSDRCRSDQLPATVAAATRSRSRWSRRTRKRRASGTTRPRRTPNTARRSSSTLATSSRRWPVRSARRIACCCKTCARATSEAIGVLTANRKPKNGGIERFANEGGGTAVGHDESACGARPARLDARRGFRSARRRRRHRRDHLVHEHVESGGHGRRRSARAKSRGERPEGQAMGQDVARAGIEGRHRLSRARRAARRTRQARLLPRRLRLHDLHRQFRSAAGRNQQGRSPKAISRSPRCCPATATSKAACIPKCKTNYLASPPLVVAYALAGTVDID